MAEEKQVDLKNKTVFKAIFLKKEAERQQAARTFSVGRSLLMWLPRSRLALPSMAGQLVPLFLCPLPISAQPSSLGKQAI